MILEACNEKCGYAAAFLAAVCLGSFGVPVKSEVVSRLDVDPLVMQVRCAIPVNEVCPILQFSLLPCNNFRHTKQPRAS